ncbi:MAG: hypothetical protein Q9220_006938 [cf. Caloplaca sp. 1 TL-2023]
MGSQEPPLDEIQWKAPPLAQSMGGIQTNTVLPYFYQSPFFDATSNNATITTQATHNPALFYLIQTREAFEGRLRTMQGLEFMVAHDPSENGSRVENSGVWVICKQNRRKKVGVEDEVIPISSYYVVGENIYMAPTLGNILTSRVLSTVHSLNKAVASASGLPDFTPALGHTYNNGVPKATASAANTQMSQTSKESTPMPGTQESTSTKPLASTSAGKYSFDSSRMLEESLNLSLRYGHEYMDENPLTGEPGAFIITKTRDAQQPSSQPKTKPVQKPSAKAPTPQIRTDLPEAKVKDVLGAEKSPTSPAVKEKKARRKSRPAGSTTTPK